MRKEAVEACAVCGLHPYDFTVDEYKRELDRVDAHRMRLVSALDKVVRSKDWKEAHDIAAKALELWMDP